MHAIIYQPVCLSLSFLTLLISSKLFLFIILDELLLISIFLHSYQISFLRQHKYMIKLIYLLMLDKFIASY